MSVSSQSRVVACLLAVLGLLAVSDGGVAARTVPQLQIGAIRSATVMPQYVPSPDKRGPFGLTVAHHSALSARWRRLQPVIHVEAEVLALCRSNPKSCTLAASRFLAIIEVGRARTGRARIGEINRAVNLAIRPVSDFARFGVPDVWTTPLTTFASGTGDCEDYAIAKYVALRQTGIAARDLRLVILHDQLANEDHAVTAARLDGHWLILDNRRMALLTDTQERNLTPLLALDSEPEESAPVTATASNIQTKPAPGLGLTANDSGWATKPVSDLFLPKSGVFAPGFQLSMTA